MKKIGLDIFAEDSNGFTLEKNCALSGKKDGYTSLHVNGSIVKINYRTNEDTDHISVAADIINHKYVVNIYNAHLINQEASSKAYIVGKYLFGHCESDGKLYDLYFEIILFPDIRKASDKFVVLLNVFSNANV